MDRAKPILECKAKASMARIIISALSVLMWGVSFFLFEDKTRLINIAYQSLLFTGALLGCWDAIELWALNKKNIPLLRIFDDRIEYKRKLWRDGYELYYFQDIAEVERGFNSVTIRLNNGWKTDVNRIDEQDFDLAKIIRESIDDYRKALPADDTGRQRKFRSVYSGKVSSLNLLKLTIVLIINAPLSYGLINEICGTFRISINEICDTFRASGFAETFLTPVGILVLSAIVIGLCVLLWHKS